MAEEGIESTITPLLAEKVIEKSTVSLEPEDEMEKEINTHQTEEMMEKEIIPLCNEEGSENDKIPLSLERGKLKGSSARKTSTENRVLKLFLTPPRALTGSCHDFCKYGREHAFVKRETKLQSRDIRFYPSTEAETEIKKLELRERNKKAVIKPKLTTSKPTVEESSDKQKTIKKKAMSSPNKNDAEAETEVKKLELRERNQKAVIKPKLTTSKPTVVESSDRQKTIKKKAMSSANKNESTIKAMISSKPTSSITKSSSLPLNCSRDLNSNRRNSLTNGTLSPSGGSNFRRSRALGCPLSASGGLIGRLSETSVPNSFMGPKDLNSRRNSLTNGTVTPCGSSFRRSSAVGRPLSASGGLIGRLSETSVRSSLKGPIGRRTSNWILSKKIGPSKIEERKPKKSLSATLISKPSNVTGKLNQLKYRNTKALSPVTNQGRDINSEPAEDKISVKTLYMIDSKSDRGSRSQSSPSSLLSQSSVSSCASFSLLEEDDLMSNSTLSDVKSSFSEKLSCGTKISDGVPKDGSKRRVRRNVVRHSEDKEGTSQKLSFRRGKVVTAKPENTELRKHKFRKGRSMGDNGSKHDLGRRSLQMKEESSSELDKISAPPETVVLRHQGMKGRKEEQGLLNDVIEETANKLVETRKSKVKALVGAFETVISRQESKPAAST